MNDEPNDLPAKAEPMLADQIGHKAARKLHARRRGAPGVWLGLGMMGIVGWSIAVPTLLGAALGILLDRENPASRSWTLALLVAGLMLGCINAWHWVAREEKAMQDEREDTGDE